MWRMSLTRPGLAGRPASSQASRLLPPFQARVVKPRISTLTPQRSSVRARMSPQIAAMVIGRPRIEPELSISSVTTVSRKSVSRSTLKLSACSGSVTTRVRRAVSSRPSSRSNCQPRHGAGEVLQLLVEQRPELVELLRRAEVGRPDDLVELLGKDLVVELVG